jgi:hypothetical protein
VGDTLFPRIVAAHETAQSIAGMLVGINDTLEAANRLPFVDVPTLTDELTAAADRLGAARQRVEEIQATLRTIKEERVARPVTFITDRTGPIITNLGEAEAVVVDTRARVDAALTRIAALKARLPRIIDLISITVTLVMLWLIAAQGFVLLHVYEYLSGKRVNWGRVLRRGNGTA